MVRRRALTCPIDFEKNRKVNTRAPLYLVLAAACLAPLACTGASPGEDNAIDQNPTAGTGATTGSGGATASGASSGSGAAGTGGATGTGGAPLSNEPVVLMIEEDTAGFCDVDGVIESTNAGFLGAGYTNTTNSIDSGVEWQINSLEGGQVTLAWRYASEGDRAGELSVNDFNVDNVPFTGTGAWTTWITESTTVTLTAGLNTIRLAATGVAGLANIDSLTVSGNGLAPGSCEDEIITPGGPTDWGGDIPQYITFLLAGSSSHNADLNIGKASGVKHYWATNFDDTTDYLTWSMNQPSEDVYHVWALLSTESAVPITLTVDGSANALQASTEAIGWQKLDMGTITIPSGANTLTFKRNSNSPNMEIKSLELIKEADVPAYQARVAAYKADTTWLSDATFGIMFQFGAWGYPKTGDRKSINDGADDFDVDAFADMIESSGARYIIWSFSWYQYWIQAPIKAVDDIMGHSNFTAERDLIGEVAQEMQDRGIRFMLYYHQGMQQEPEWKAKQAFPGEFDDTGSGDRTVFFNNWKSVMKDVGARYGTNLDGWFFDDGAVYYPAHFEDLARAARTGNPNRFISYNNVNNVRYTDFQDLTLGERRMSAASYYGAPPVGGDGIFTKGPMEGLFQHSMNPADYWGIFEANQSVTTGMSQNGAVNAMLSARERNVAISLSMVMWEDGSVLQSTLDVMKAVGAALGE